MKVSLKRLYLLYSFIKEEDDEQLGSINSKHVPPLLIQLIGNLIKFQN